MLANRGAICGLTCRKLNNMSIEFEGFSEVLKELDRISDLETVTKALNKATALVEGEAKKKAPKGELRNSITSKVDGLKGYIYTPLEYAPYIEYGTGIFAEGEGGGRKEVPWVYVKGSSSANRKKTIHTEESADQAVAFLRSKGLEAYKTSGQKPQPYMRPALDENKEEIKRILMEGLLSG